MLPFLLKHDHDKLSALRRHATVLTNIIINMSKSTWLLMMYSALAMKGLPVAMNSLPLDMARLQSGKCLRAQGISGQQAGAAKPSMLSSCWEALQQLLPAVFKACVSSAPSLTTLSMLLGHSQSTLVFGGVII